jgi:transcriptional regulator with XRE-family HTH domain
VKSETMQERLARIEINEARGRRIRAMRLALGWTQKELAISAGISIGVVRSMDQGMHASANAVAKVEYALADIGSRASDASQIQNTEKK